MTLHSGILRPVVLLPGAFTSRGVTTGGSFIQGSHVQCSNDLEFSHPGVLRPEAMLSRVLLPVVSHPGVLHTGISHPGVSRSGIFRPVVWRPWALPSGVLYPWVLPSRVLRQGVLHPAEFRKSSTVLSARSVRTQTYFRLTLLPEIRLCSQAAPRALAFSFDVNVIETLSILGQGQVFHSIYAPCCKTLKPKNIPFELTN